MTSTAFSLSARSHRAQQGYTLIELLVVLVILGLLATIATTQVLKYLAIAKVKTAHTQIESISSALDLLKLDAGQYPTTQEGLTALTAAPSRMEHWNGPYIKNSTSLIDPWGRPYIYRMPGQHGEFDLYSYGPDVEGGSHGDPAIKNWQ